MRDGEVLPTTSFTRTARTGATTVTDLIDARRVLAEFADGTTVVLQSLQRWWPPLTRFCHDLAAELGHAVQANAYLTPPGAAGLAPHHDTHDVFVLQLAGSKHWRVAEPVVRTPLRRHGADHERSAEQPLLFEADLAPGDCLYLPRGFVHSATAQEGVSLHLTIGILATTVHDLVRRIVDRTAEDEAFRRTLPPGHADDAAAAARTVKEAVAELLQWLERFDPEELASELAEAAPRKRPALLDGQLLELARLPDLDDAAIVVLRRGAACRIDAQGGELVVHLGDRRLTLPVALEPAIRRLTDGRPHPVGELADLLDGPSRLVLVRRLIREAVLRRGDGE